MTGMPQHPAPVPSRALRESDSAYGRKSARARALTLIVAPGAHAQESTAEDRRVECCLLKGATGLPKPSARGGRGRAGGRGEGSVLSSPAGGLACRASFLAPFSSPGTRRSDGHDIRVGDRRTMKEALF